jgi:hypothetical protein
MPYESLTCPKCGSSDSREVKPGTHFCNHCDNVFKYVLPTAKGGGGGGAACATCGVIAAGLCLTCNRHFCEGHQAVKGSIRYFDCCAACFNERQDEAQAADAKKRAEAVACSRRSGLIYLEQSARSELMAARVPVVRLYHLGPHMVTRFGRTRLIEDYNWGHVGSGWLLGDFNWVSRKSTGISQTVLFSDGILPTHHYEASDFTASTHRSSSVRFGRVTGKAADGCAVGFAGELKASYEELGEAVQRLAGTSEQHQ